MMNFTQLSPDTCALLAIIGIHLDMPQAPALSLTWPGLASHLDTIARHSPRSNDFLSWTDSSVVAPYHMLSTAATIRRPLVAQHAEEAVKNLRPAYLLE